MQTTRALHFPKVANKHIKKMERVTCVPHCRQSFCVCLHPTCVAHFLALTSLICMSSSDSDVLTAILISNYILFHKYVPL